MAQVRQESGGKVSSVQRWQIAVAVLAVLTLTLLLINVVLRSRLDAARTAEAQAVAAAEDLRSENADVVRRNEQLLTQLSSSNEKLSGLIDRLNVTKKQLSAAEADVARQVASQRIAERAVRQADTAARKARARAAALRFQLANAQTCSAAGIKALAQIHSGPDIETGATQAADTLESVLPACRAGLR
jgi:chromosome segregation ATPase